MASHTATGAVQRSLSNEARRARRAFWLKQLHQWHWVSAAICLIGMLGFAVTGITLNHAADIDTRPVTTRSETTLPAALATRLRTSPASADAPVSAAVVQHVSLALSVDIANGATEWSDDEIYVSLPRPGGDAFVTIDRESGVVEYEVTSRGWISYLNDLHKGRNTGRAWAWFLDAFAIGCVLFCVTGLFLLQMHSGRRPTTWPLVALGLVVPVLLGLLFVH